MITLQLNQLSQISLDILLPLWKKGIRANTIVPHGIINNASKGFIKNFKRLSPIGRTCNKKELRGPFIFLSSEASSYMNGSLFVIDGGWTAW